MSLSINTVHPDYWEKLFHGEKKKIGGKNYWIEKGRDNNKTVCVGVKWAEALSHFPKQSDSQLDS